MDTNVTKRTATLFSLFMGKKMQIHRFVAQCSLISYHKNIVLFLTGQHWAADDIWKLSTWHLPKPAPCSPGPIPHRGPEGRFLCRMLTSRAGVCTEISILPYRTWEDFHGPHRYVLYFIAIAEDCLDVEGWFSMPRPLVGFPEPVTPGGCLCSEVEK